MILAALMLVGNIPATAAGTVTSTVTVGLHPYGVAFAPDGEEAYVTNRASGTVSVINVASGTVTSTIPVGREPHGVAITPDGSTAYVTNRVQGTAGTVSVIDVASGTVTSTIPAGPQPWGIAFTPDGSKAYVTNSHPVIGNTVSVITVASGTVTSTIPVGTMPVGVAFTPDGSKAFVTCSASGTVFVIDVAPGTVTSGPIPVGTNPHGVAVTPDGSTVYVTNFGSSTVSVIAVASRTVTSTIPVESFPSGVAFTPDGSTAYVATGTNTVSVITVNPAAPVFTADTPPATATVGAAYSYTFAASGNPAPQFTVSSGSLPAGLALDPVTGVLSGTPTTGRPGNAYGHGRQRHQPRRGHPTHHDHREPGSGSPGVHREHAGRATFTVTATNGVSPDAVTPRITITVTRAPVR